MSYQGDLGRQLNIDFVNLGFSGNGLGEARDGCGGKPGFRHPATFLILRKQQNAGID